MHMPVSSRLARNKKEHPRWMLRLEELDSSHNPHTVLRAILDSPVRLLRTPDARYEALFSQRFDLCPRALPNHGGFRISHSYDPGCCI